MQFKDVVGQEKVKERLIYTIKENRVSHAQLFLGAEGSGNLTLAIAYAQYVSCTDRQADDSCGVCPSCIKYQKLIHPDLHFVFPVATSKTVTKEPVSDDYISQWRQAIIENPYITQNRWYEIIDVENKQGIISKNESQEILRKLNLKTFESEYKIMKEKHGLSFEKAKDIAHLSNGNYAEAQRILNLGDDDNYNFEQFTHLMRMAYQRKLIDINEWVEEISRLGREKQKNFLVYCLRLVRENLMLNLQKEEIAYLTKKEYEFSSKFSQFITQENVHQIYEEFNRAHSDIEMNAYNKIVFLDLALKIIKLIKK